MTEELYQDLKAFLPSNTSDEEIKKLMTEMESPVYIEIKDEREYQQLELEYQQEMQARDEQEQSQNLNEWLALI